MSGSDSLGFDARADLLNSRHEPRGHRPVADVYGITALSAPRFRLDA